MRLFDELKRFARPYPDEDSEEYEVEDYPTRDSGAAPVVDRSQTGKVVSINTTTQLEVVLTQPTLFDVDSPDIAGHLIRKKTVVLNLEKADAKNTRRFLDFFAGVVYAQEGNLKQVAARTYIITPYNVDIRGAELINELESCGMYA